jgi:hypothetical protein
MWSVYIISFAPSKGWITLTCANMFLFHKDLMEKLESQNYITGLRVVPVFIEIPEQGTLNDWMWVSSTKDLGEPLLHRRFVRGFQRNNWNGEDFCTSSFYDWDSLFVSQRVFECLDALPGEKKGEIEFVPIELVN